MLKPRYIAAVPFVILVAGCASDPYYGAPRHVESRTVYPSSAPVAYAEEGRVVAIDSVPGGNHTSGAGAVLGGIVGGVVGHQIGSGRGNTAATVVGAGAGALAGNEIERRRSDEGAYRVTIRFRDGRETTVMQDDLNGMRVGDTVRFEGGRLYR